MFCWCGLDQRINSQCRQESDAGLEAGCMWTTLLLSLDVPSTLLDAPPTRNHSLFDSLTVWAFEKESELLLLLLFLITYIFFNLTVLENGIWELDLPYLHAFEEGACFILRLKRTWSQWPVLTFTTGLKFQVATVVTIPWKLDPDSHKKFKSSLLPWTLKKGHLRLLETASWFK